MNIVRKQGDVAGFTVVDTDASSHIVFTDYDSYFGENNNDGGWAFLTQPHPDTPSPKDGTAFLIREFTLYQMQVNDLGGYHYTEIEMTGPEFREWIGKFPVEKIIYHVYKDNQMGRNS